MGLGQQEFSDQQLREIALDPRLTAKDVELLSPEDRARFGVIFQQVKDQRSGRGGEQHQEAQGPGRWEQGLSAIRDFGTGAIKGAGETAITLGRGVNSITEPIGNAIGGAASRMMYGDEAVSPPVNRQKDLNAAYDYTQPENDAESYGKTAEQIGEYLIPAGAARKAAVEGLVRYGIPNSASAGTMSVLNKVAAVLGRSAGEAGSAAAISGLHGEQQPEHEAMAAAAIPFMNELVAMGVRPANWLAPFLAGGLAGKAAGPLGIVGGLGIGAAARKAIRLSPQGVDALHKFIRQYGANGLRALVGGYEQYRGQQNGMPSAEQDLERLFSK